MQRKLSDVDEQPGNPAVPFFLGAQILCNQNQNGYAGVQIRVRVGREKSVEHPAPAAGDDEHGDDGEQAFIPAEHGNLERSGILAALLVLFGMCPSVVPYDIDYQ